MTKEEYNEAAALVVRLRKDLELHTDALKQSNAQCAEYLRQNEQLHSELVKVRAAIAAVSAERDSLKRTLKEWEEAETKPHVRIGLPVDMTHGPADSPVYIHEESIADHVVPPVLPMCMTCHECGGELRPSPAAGSHSVLYCRTERCSRKNTAWQDDVSPYSGACNSSTPVRHE